MQLEFFELSTAGDRAENQDSMAHIVNDDYALFIVADGLGGHHAGEKASQYFCQGMLDSANTFCKMIAKNPCDILLSWIDEAVNQMRISFADDDLASKAHTTCAVLYLDKELTLTAHCGDSRIYRMNPYEILWRTRDHSIPQDMVDVGLITEAELAHHPEQNQLTRSININKEHPIDIQLYPAIQKNETFVLCSDGFWGNINTNEFLQLAELNSDKENLARLSRLSVYRAMGKSDNLTVQAIRCRQ